MYKTETFWTGESFHRVASDIIPDDWLENDNDDGHWFIPSVVNMAFACELYLKSLVSDGQNEVYGHKFTELYERLSNQNKTSITENPCFKGDDEFRQKRTCRRVLVERGHRQIHEFFPENPRKRRRKTARQRVGQPEEIVEDVGALSAQHERENKTYNPCEKLQQHRRKAFDKAENGKQQYDAENHAAYGIVRGE